MKLPIAAIACSSSILVGTGITLADEEQLGIEQAAISGGSPDASHDAVVALVIDNGSDEVSACTGSVVAHANGSAWILTAAHCVADGEGEDPPPVSPAQVKVTLGDDRARDLAEGAYFGAVEVVLAPGFSGLVGSPNDVALVRLAGDLPPVVPLSVLSPTAEPPSVGETVTLVGFGRTEAGENSLRRMTEQTIVRVDAKFIGLDQANGRGICSGDSGGPMLVEREGRLAIAAVNSFAGGTRDAPCGTHASGVRSSPFVEFVNQHVSAPATAHDEPSDCSFTPARARNTGRLSWLLLIAVACVSRARRRFAAL
jgi:secreted trypsin-like serine protease